MKNRSRVATRPGRRRKAAKSASIAPKGGLVIPEKWEWHYRKLLAVRDALLKERGGQLAEAAEPLEAASMHMADAASDEAEHDLALAELSTEQDELYQVDEALRRIQSNTYGVCEATGKPISKERLRAIPWTRFSKEAEGRLERRGVVGHTHIGAVKSVRDSGALLAETREELEAREVSREDAINHLDEKVAESVGEEATEEPAIPPRKLRKPRPNENS